MFHETPKFNNKVESNAISEWLGISKEDANDLVYGKLCYDER